MTRLRELAGARSFTLADKIYIRDLSARLGIEFVERPRCGSCFRDQALILFKALKATEAAVELPAKPAVKLRAGVDVIYKGQRVNADTLTADTAAAMMADGLQYLFER